MTEVVTTIEDINQETEYELALKESRAMPRLRYYVIVVLYLTLFVVFLILMNIAGNSSIPLALPFLFVLLFYEARKGKNPFEGIGIKKQDTAKEIGIGVLVGVGIAFVTYYSLIWSILSGQAIGDTSSSFVFADGFPFPLNLALEIVYIFAFLTPAEEVLFRGFIQGSIQKRASRGFAIFVQSAIFGLIHVAIMLPFLPILFCLTYGLSAALVAVVFGVMFAWRNGNVIASWTSHGVVNSLAAAIVMISLFML